jgi:hypothetical protein
LTPIFTINFRREAWQREVARSRARVVSLAVWLFYFGAIAVIFGLYGLNFVTLLEHTRMVERQAAAQKATRPDEIDWSKQAAELGLIERGVMEPALWSERLQRLATLFPLNARLTSVDFNPGGVAGGSDWNKLVLTGTLKSDPNQDRMRGVANLVARLKGDSLLARSFHSVRLASTRITESSGTEAEFVLELRP